MHFVYIDKNNSLWKLSTRFNRDVYSNHSPPPPGGGGKLLSKLKNSVEFEGGLEKGGERRKKEKSDKIKHTLKYLYEA